MHPSTHTSPPPPPPPLSPLQELIDSERHHVYTKEDLEDELQVFDNGLLANQRIPRDSSGRQQRPTTSCIRS